MAGRKRVYCLETATGKVIWQQAFDYKMDGVSCSLAVVDGVAILICRGFYGFDALSGQLRWQRAEAPGPWNREGTWGSYPSPVCWSHEGKNYVVCSCKNVELMDPATGKAIWKIPWVEGAWSSWSGQSSPAISGDLMVINQKAGGLEGYSLSLEGPTKLWHIPDHDVATSPLIYQGSVYVIGGGDYNKTTSIKCADLLSGSVAWERALTPQGASSPVAADGKIFGYGQFGRILAMWKADPNTYTLMAAAPVKADGYSSLAFADGRLYLRMLDGVACYDVSRAGNPDVSEAAREKWRGVGAQADLAWNQAQADKGDAFGELRMGERYRDGEGVARDSAKAREWFAKAAAQGNDQAKKALAALDKQPN